MEEKWWWHGQRLNLQATTITDLCTLGMHSNYFLFVTMAKLILNYVSFELMRPFPRIYLWHKMRLLCTNNSSLLKGINYQASSTNMYLSAILYNEKTIPPADIYCLSCAQHMLGGCTHSHIIPNDHSLMSLLALCIFSCESCEAYKLDIPSQ